MSGAEILVIEADAERRGALATVLEFIDYGAPCMVDACARWEESAQDLGNVQVVILGQCGQGKQDLAQVFESIRRWDANVPVLLMGTRQELKNCPEALRVGALTSVDVPLKYQQLNHALQQAMLFRDQRDKRPIQRSPELFRSLVGNSRPIRDVRGLIEQVADTDANVLILGESGTGKEVVARNLHYHSSRRDKPFVPVNCGAIPPDLLESELFGHEKGAFTGAISSRQGRFEMADGGTLFLDEIGDMSMPMQVKLLRVLQERSFERVGSNKTISVDVRIIAATHRNLEEAIQEDRFREDLYYRLNVFPIQMPPLRERIEDIPLMVSELVTRLEHEKRGSLRLTPGAVMALCQYHWPGNVRELANLVERLIIMHPYGVVDVHDLPVKYRGDLGEVEGEQTRVGTQTPVITIAPTDMPRLPREGLNLKEHLHNLELNLIKQALDDADGVVAHAAHRLHLRRTTLVEKLRKYGLHRSEHAS